MASQNPESSQGNVEDISLTSDELRDLKRWIQQRRDEQSKQSSSPPSSQPESLGKATTIQKLSQFKKFAPKPFKEAKKPNEAEEWLEELEAVLEALHTEEADKMIFTEFLLQGEARLWWKMEKEKREDKIWLWKEFQDLFLRRYFPISVHERKRKEFLYLTQGNQTVMEYDRAFTQLSRFARSLVATEKDKVERFVHGLKLSLQKDLALCELSSHADALDKALKAEWVRDQMKEYNRHAQQKTGQDKKKRPSYNSGHRNQKVKKKKADLMFGSDSLGKCPKCGRQHELEECPMITGACFHCKERGHKAANCPGKF